ncbi:hypothetical protein [Pseudomarimonas arenosa]|uniref:Uncharacterized protein n=1 Tax=Pseudomarimonas arenosa TaxID=2774145 RepID=A0AAW3ZRP0_9GAMM|nr:hypothetical protein [Pseudomarimonas arenosa]MBD8527545.1 hypothetical protein [Pseudomarimonas arenosa]
MASFLGNYISEDGETVFFSGRRQGAPTYEFEIYSWQPRAGQLRQLTSNTPVVNIVDPLGFYDFIPRAVAGASEDGRYVFVSYEHRTRTVAGNQRILLSRNETPFRIDTQAGSISTLQTPLLAAASSGGHPFGSTVTSVSDDGRFATLTECALETGLQSANECGIPWLFDLQDGSATAISDLLTPLTGHTFNGAAGLPAAAGSAQISGDGGSLVIASLANLFAAPGTNWQQTPNNLARIANLPYRLDLTTNQLDEAVDVDLSVPRAVPGFAFLFVRNLGVSGGFIPLNRDTSYTGITVPSSPFDIVAFAGPDRQAVPIIEPSVGPRGRLGPMDVRISELEDRVYFVSERDLLGLNPSSSRQVFSYEIATAAIRQLTSFNDGRQALSRLGLDALLNAPSASMQVGAVSADHRLLVVTTEWGDDRTRSLQPVSSSSAPGRRIIRDTRVSLGIPRGLSTGVFAPAEVLLLGCEG